MRYEIWKEMLNSPVKGGLELGPSRQKARNLWRWNEYEMIYLVLKWSQSRVSGRSQCCDMCTQWTLSSESASIESLESVKRDSFRN